MTTRTFFKTHACISRIFSRKHFPDLLFTAAPDKNGQPALNRPMAHLSFALNWYFGKDSPVGYRSVNILIHFLTAFVLFLVIRDLLDTPACGGKSPIARGLSRSRHGSLGRQPDSDSGRSLYRAADGVALVPFLSARYLVLHQARVAEQRRRGQSFIVLTLMSFLAGCAQRRMPFFCRRPWSCSSLHSSRICLDLQCAGASVSAILRPRHATGRRLFAIFRGAVATGSRLQRSPPLPLGAASDQPRVRPLLLEPDFLPGPQPAFDCSRCGAVAIRCSIHGRHFPPSWCSGLRRLRRSADAQTAHARFCHSVLFPEPRRRIEHCRA